MAFYLFTGKYTTASIKGLVEKPSDREAAGRALIEAGGGKLHHLFFAFGEEDIYVLIEAPDDRTMASIAFAIGSTGVFSGGATTKLMTAGEAMEAMGSAKAALSNYAPPGS